MSFLQPLGLIALIGIPILIIIYIIKPRYQEKKITSTYIWRLSLKYKKKKRPIQWLQKSLLFFIQLLIITLLALSIARPELIVQAKSKEKIIILDVSASMNTEQSGKSRFDKAIDRINSLVRFVDDDDPMTIIIADNNPRFLVKRESSVRYLNYVLKNLECTFEEADYSKAVELANEVLEINKNAEVMLFTDHDFKEEGYIQVENLANKEWNAGISDFYAELVNGYYVFTAKIENYNQSKKFEVYLNVDNKKYEKTIELTCSDSFQEELVIDDLQIANFTSSKLSLRIDGKIIDDSFDYDNEFMYYQGQNKKFKVLLVGEETNFINASLQATGLCAVYKPQDDVVEYEGYDIYVFDSFVPENLPLDGAVWLFNVPESKLDYQVIDDVEGEFNLLPTAIDTSIYQEIMKNTYQLDKVNITKYQKVNSIENYEVLMTCNGDPVVFTKKLNKANIIVFAVDLHYTDLPVNINMPILINNMVNYSAHQLLDKYEYNVGDNITLYPRLRTKEMTINGEVVYTSDELDLATHYVVNKPGRYEVKQTLNDGTVITNYFFVRMGEQETNFDYEGDVLAAEEYNSLSANAKISKNNVDVIFYVAAILLFLILVEWGLSYHEQY